MRNIYKLFASFCAFRAHFRTSFFISDIYHCFHSFVSVLLAPSPLPSVTMMSSIRCHADSHDRRYASDASATSSFLAADDEDTLATLDVCAISEVSSRLLDDGSGKNGRGRKRDEDGRRHQQQQQTIMKTGGAEKATNGGTTTTEEKRSGRRKWRKQ